MRFIISIILVVCTYSIQAEEALVIQDFEKDVPVDKWPGNIAGDVKITSEWQKDGSKGLKIDPKLMFSLSTFKTRNWKAYDILRVHFNNTGASAATVGFEIRDKHNGFRERHSSGFGVKAGESSVDIDISGALWRGEENKPYLGKIKTPMEMDLVKRISFYNHSESTIYLDRIEIVKVKKVAVDGAYAFDFGPSKTQVMSQMIGITEKTSFNARNGYGFKGAGFANLRKHMSFPTPMLGDGIGMRSGSFNVNLKGGKYIGLIAFERGGFWEDEYSTYTKASLKVNGKVAHSHTYATDGSDFMFQDTEIQDLDQMAEKLIWPAHAINEFSFTATNGVNAFQLAVEGARQYPLRIAGLILAPDTKDGMAFLKHHIDAQHKRIGKVFTAGDKSRRAGRNKPVKKLVAEELPVGLMMFPGDLPVNAAGGAVSKKLAVAGQTLTVHLGVYGTSRQDVEVVTSKTAKIKPSISYGRYMPMRNYGVGSVWLEVNHYRPDTKFSVGPGLSRSVILEYKIDKGFGNGVINDTVELRAGSQRVKLPIEIKVSKVSLESIPIPVGLYMNSLPIPEKQMDSSAWWRLQESVLEEQVGSGLTALSGGPSIEYSVKQAKISGDNAVKYIRIAQKYGPIHAIVGYGGFFHARTFKSGLGDLKAVAEAIDAFEKRENLPTHYVNSFDEPRHGTDELKNVLKYLTPNFKAGIRTIGWSSWGSHSDIIKTLSKNSYAAAVNGHKAEHFSKIKELGAEPWVYNNGLDRYGMGIHLWRGMKFGAQGRMQWIGMFTQGFAFHNLDGREPSKSCFLVHKELGALKTPLWLGVREGLLDARLRLTLEKVAKEGDPALSAWTLDETTYRKDQKTWTGEKLEEARRVMLERILELSK